MEELQVPTRRIRVQIATNSGDSFEGALFAPEMQYRTRPVEYVLHLLNDDRDFLPFQLEADSGRSLLFNKSHIVRVHLGTDGRWADPFEQAAERQEFTTYGADMEHEVCTALLSDGTRLSGRLAVETRWSSSRLLDKLNLNQRFVPLVTDEGIEFVQRNQMVRIE
jgi:hypothetical protein